MSECAEILSPSGLSAALIQSATGIAATRGPQKILQQCPSNSSQKSDPAIRKGIDDALICKLACCCLSNPLVGIANQNLMQGCMEKALKGADALLGFNSRYKPETSFDMTKTPPSPFMHRENGFDTTEPSHRWQQRAQDEIQDFAGGQGKVRRPDLVIVNDPCQPPNQGNIERVIEFKFREDKRDIEQDKAYRRIAGDRTKYSVFRIGSAPEGDEQGCDCGQQQKPEPQPQPVAAPFPVEEKENQGAWGSFGSAVGWGALTVIGVVATAALLISPFDGPVGEAAAGSATLASGARAAAAWKRLSAAL